MIPLCYVPDKKDGDKKIARAWGLILYYTYLWLWTEAVDGVF